MERKGKINDTRCQVQFNLNSVPQGTVIWPLLFPICINEILDLLSFGNII